MSGQVSIGAGVFQAGATLALYWGSNEQARTTVGQDCTALFEGLQPGEQYTAAQVDGKSPRVSVRSKTPGGVLWLQPTPEGVWRRLQAEAQATGNPTVRTVRTVR